jgi:hypothetical protein
MAYQHGTATSTIDLWNKLIAFLTTDAALVATGEEWDVVWTAAGGQAAGVVLKGPGASGNDQILVGLNRVDAQAADAQQIQIRGMTAILSSAPDIDSHVNDSGVVGALLDSGAMEYWFVASGRRFVMIAKISTVYEAIYGGLFLPYANPISYPYPLMIGGSYSANFVNAARPANWRSQSYLHAHFTYPAWNVEFGQYPDNQRSSCHYLDVAGAWHPVTIDANSYAQMAPYIFDPAGDVDDGTSWPYNFNTAGANGDVPYFSDQMGRLEENVGGGFALNQFTITTSQPVIETVGVIDGCYHVPGQNNAVENIVQIDGVDYLVMQNVFRTDVRQYWALRLN